MVNDNAGSDLIPRHKTQLDLLTWTEVRLVCGFSAVNGVFVVKIGLKWMGGSIEDSQPLSAQHLSDKGRSHGRNEGKINKNKQGQILEGARTPLLTPGLWKGEYCAALHEAVLIVSIVTFWL